MPKRALHILVICVFALTMLGASSPDRRYDNLGHNLVCQCGCNQILLECNHVGCPVSPVMIEELRTQIAAGLPNAGVLNFFIAKYGAIALAAPMRGGFDDVAWIVPFVVFVFGIFGVALLIRFWKRRSDSLIPAGGGAASLPPIDSMQDRIRRDTDYDSWSDSGSGNKSPK
jgi:cytochrome c-type biogenesis protein CcmH/NrfF